MHSAPHFTITVYILQPLYAKEGAYRDRYQLKISTVRSSIVFLTKLGTHGFTEGRFKL